MNNNDEMNENKKGRGRGLIAGIIIGLLIACFLLVIGSFLKIGKKPVSGDNPGSTVDATEASKELSVTDLLKAVLTLKSDLKAAAEDISEGNLDLATLKIDSVTEKTATIRASLDASMEAMGDSLPSLQAQLVNIQNILNLVDTASAQLIHPAIRQMAAHPLTGLRVGDGINTAILCEYLDFAESLMPGIEIVVNQANAADLSVVDSDGDIIGYLDKINKMMELYHKNPNVISMAKTALGADGDRVYMVAAQNSAEIRASGGFPGAVGSIEIKDGVLLLNDFKKVYDVLSSYTPATANITQTEQRLFHYGLSAPRDADYCPDFERVAEIWALGYETGMHTPVDGVISMTPAIVQKLLAAIGDEITLFDGMVLDGTNAAKGLQHDLYFNYFGSTFVTNANVVTDQLFADAAKKTMQKTLENLTPENLIAYLEIAKDAFADRTLMLWAKDEASQALIQEMGWSGGLNNDPQKPLAGVYYNCTLASKMGWFLVVDTSMGERTKNSDGSYTYPISVTFSNDITQEEIRAARAYISGGNNGAFGGSAYFFAPAGGVVSDFTTTNGLYIQKDNYHDLDLGFIASLNIQPGASVTVTYKVTTAPGVETPLEFSKTPTLQEYH